MNVTPSPSSAHFNFLRLRNMATSSHETGNSSAGTRHLVDCHDYPGCPVWKDFPDPGQPGAANLLRGMQVFEHIDILPVMSHGSRRPRTFGLNQRRDLPIRRNLQYAGVSGIGNVHNSVRIDIETAKIWVNVCTLPMPET